MAVAYRGLCTGGNNGGTGSVALQTITLPAGCVVDDILVAVADANTGSLTCTSSIGSSISGPNTNSGSTQRSYMFAKSLTASDISTGTFTTTWSSTAVNLTSGIVISGGSGWGIPQVTVNSTAGTSVTMPSVTTAGTGYGVVQFVNTRGTSGPQSATYPAGWTKRGTLATANATVGNNRNSQPATLDTPDVVGTYGGETVTLGSAMSHLYTIAITPAGPSNIRVVRQAVNRAGTY